MANKVRGFGLTAELDRKKAAKWDVDLTRQAVEWMQEVTHEPLDAGDYSSDKVHAALKDGVYLCKVANTLKPGCIRKINETKMAFKQMENINNFLDACDKQFGMVKIDLFQTVDLYEAGNMPNVVNTIFGLGRKAHNIPGYSGPGLGPKESKEHKRDFSEEQLKAGQNVIGLQMGSNKGASQAGQSFGKNRQILD